MATSTNKAKSFFEQRKNATKTSTIVEAAAAATEEKIEPKASTIVETAATATEKETKVLLPEPQGVEQPLKKENDDVGAIPQKKATGEKISTPVPPDLKKFIETINYDNKINVNLPVEIDNRLQIALLRLKSKYALNNRQMNKTVLLSYIIDKMLREDEFFGDLT